MIPSPLTTMARHQPGPARQRRSCSPSPVGRRMCDWGSFSGHGGALAQEVPQTLGDESWRLLVRREVVEAVQYFHCCIGDHLLEGGK
jgi:hypothetical protein